MHWYSHTDTSPFTPGVQNFTIQIIRLLHVPFFTNCGRLIQKNPPPSINLIPVVVSEWTHYFQVPLQHCWLRHLLTPAENAKGQCFWLIDLIYNHWRLTALAREYQDFNLFSESSEGGSLLYCGWKAVPDSGSNSPKPLTASRHRRSQRVRISRCD